MPFHFCLNHGHATLVEKYDQSQRTNELREQLLSDRRERNSGRRSNHKSIKRYDDGHRITTFGQINTAKAWQLSF